MAAPKAATIQELLERNKTVSTTHEPRPDFTDLAKLGLDLPHTAIISCADPRVVPEYIFNIQPTDGIVVFRNVGGHVIHTVNDLLALDHTLKLNDILIIHHTDCGTTHFKDHDIREGLKARLSGKSEEVDRLGGFGEIADLEQSVRDDVTFLRSNPFVRKELAANIIGFVYDIKTGLLTPVKN